MKDVWRRKGEEKGGVENIKEVWRRGGEERCGGA